MIRKARRTSSATRPRVECLEARTLLSLTDPVHSLLVGLEGSPTNRDVQLALWAVKGQVETYRPDGPSLVALDPSTDVDTAIERLSTSRGIRYAERNAPIQASAVSPVSDRNFSQLWGLNNTNDVDIDAPEAWTVTTGNPSTIVAVVDTGINLNHPDLAGRVWVNPGEIPNNGIDDDHDGKVDDVNGWNFINNTSNINDDDGHGTHISGTIAARANNDIGIAGINWRAQIMPLKFLDSQGNGLIDNAVSAIYYAVDHGARVINASWGGDENSWSLGDAINYASAHNVVFVTVAGNQSHNNDTYGTYPSSAKYSNTISVAAIDSAGNLASFSNYGAKSVDIAAPGVGIFSTVLGSGYASYSGTSMAVPHVVGTVALLAGLHPEWSAAQLVQVVLATAKPLPSLTGKVRSGGIVDAARALNASISGGAVSAARTGLVANDIRQIVFASGEYYNLHGGTDSGLIDGLYRDLLGHPADDYSLNVWLGQFRDGAGRGDVIRQIMNSTEARRTTIARWFISDLKRPADTLAQLKSNPTVGLWADLIVAGRASEDQVRATIINSMEYSLIHGANDPGLIDGLYSDLLGHPADNFALNFWTGQIRNGMRRSDMINQILVSTEARRYWIAQTFLADLKRPADSLSSLLADPTIGQWASVLRS